MKISYNWLKQYIALEESAEEVAKILTSIGLEVGNMEEVESIKGGLKGIVAGKVVTCEPHPNSDHLSKTTVDVGGAVLPIVCGAPNVAAGQKVMVAVVGTTLYSGDEKFEIKKAKIRGEVSEGMICSETEIGVGNDGSGIMVLPEWVVPGTPAQDYFKVENDFMLEVDLTPNRIDSASHIGIARDLAAYLGNDREIGYSRPSVSGFTVDNNNLPIPVEVLNPEACPRYCGVTIAGVEIKESPEWLKNRLKTIGLNPINNVVDITNFVLFECGQPLHAFDADEIAGGKVIVRTLPQGTKFTTLDGIDRELNENDLMICNAAEGMCIGGVFGGSKSGIKESTKNIFLESACFDPVFIRKTARRHGLSTDASFRFERGTDPNGTIFALKRAALLIKEIAGGAISSDIIDIYPQPIEDFRVDITYSNVARLIGKDLGVATIKKILSGLEIKIISETEKGLSLAVPPYRVDVKREADVIEEILRIYGYNNVEIPVQVRSSIQTSERPDPQRIRNLVSEMLTAAGFNEIWSNSLTKASYYENNPVFESSRTVKLFNPLSNDLAAMRQTLLYGGLECIAYNANRQNPNLRLYEFGNCYFDKGTNIADHPADNFEEEEHLALFITGKKEQPNWVFSEAESSFYQVKSFAENVFKRLGLSIRKLQVEAVAGGIFSDGLEYKTQNGKSLMQVGVVHPSFLKRFGIENPVYYADINWWLVMAETRKNKVAFEELPKYPEVRRDLALLIDTSATFGQISQVAYKTERQLLRDVNLFDVYEGQGIPDGKKSYAVSFILRDDERTLNEKQIDKVMEKLVAAFDRELGAKLR